MTFPDTLPDVLPNRAAGGGFAFGRPWRLLPLLAALPCLAATSIRDVECAPLDPKTGRADIAYTVEAETNDAPARLTGVVLDRATGRSLGRASLLGCPAGPLAPGRHRVVWNALADAAFRPVGQVELRLFAEPIIEEKAEETRVEEEKERPDLLYYCTFDDASSVSAPAVGPSGTFLGGTFGPGRVGGALRVERDASAFETRFSKGVLGTEGCIEFWAKIEGDNPVYGDGGDPLFFSLFDERNSITLLQFAANNGMGRGGLGGAIDSWPFGSTPHYALSMEYATILGPNWGDWHHYAMSWKADAFPDGSYVKVFVDGVEQPVLGGVDDDKVPGRLANYASHDYVLGTPWPRSRRDRRSSQKPFWMDELKIWKMAKTEFGLLFHCSLDSADAIAACGGTVTGAEFVEGVQGKAVQVGHARDPICFPLENVITDFRRGSVEIWAKILEPDNILSSSASELNLVNLRQVNDDIGNFFRITLTTNNGHGQSGLVGGISIHDKASTHIGRIGPFDIADAIGGDDPKEWHHYRLSWDVDGIGGGNDRTAVFVDNRKVVSSTEPLFDIKPAWDHFRYILKISESNGIQPWAVFDELKLWDHAIVPEERMQRQGDGLLLHCAMDSLEDVRSCGGSAGKVSFVPGHSGQALHIDGGVPLTFPLNGTIPDLGRGCVDFWARIPNAGRMELLPEAELNLARLRRAGERDNIYFRAVYTVNDGQGHGGLVGQMADNIIASTQSFGTFSADSIVGGSAGDWHRYTVSWDAHGIAGTPDTLAVYVDGRKVAATQGVPNMQEAWNRKDYVLSVGETRDDQISVEIDELRYWDHAILEEGKEQ